jgi:hypothetical protein
MSGDVHVRICERVGVRLPRATRLDVAASGKIYFSDASVKFGAQKWGSTYEASLLDIMEHGWHGRLLVFDPQAGKATTVLDGLNFPNGVAVSHDQMYVLQCGISTTSPSYKGHSCKGALMLSQCKIIVAFRRVILRIQG